MTEDGSNRVNRGGSWNNDAQNCRVAYRNNNSPSNSNSNLGFRLASTNHPVILPGCVFTDAQRVGEMKDLP